GASAIPARAVELAPRDRGLRGDGAPDPVRELSRPLAASAGRCRAGSRGQATLELVAGGAAVLLFGLIGLQLVAVGSGAVMADHAAEAAALALANGREPEAAAR